MTNILKYITIYNVIIMFALFSCNNNSTNSNTEPLILELVPTHVSMNGIDDGAINLSVSGGKNPYKYKWSNGEITEDITNLTVGIYAVTVTDKNSQSISDSVEIKQRLPLIISLTPKDVSRFGNSDGSIDLVVNSGVEPIEFNWSNGETTEDINELTSGWYSVEVKDFFHQIVIDSTFISEPPLIMLDTVHVNDKLIIAEQPDLGGVNISIYSHTDGVLLIDSGYERNADHLGQNIKAINNKKLTHIISTHPHDDHIGGNSLLDKSGTIIGHLDGSWEFKNSNSNASFVGYSKKDSIDLYDEIIVLYPTEMQGHSNADLIAYFKNSEVVFMGDLYLSESFPSVSTTRGAKVQNAILLLEFAINTFPNAKWIIPGHGNVSTIDELKDYLEMVKETVNIVRGEMALGKDLETIIKENVLSDYNHWGTALVNLDTAFWIEAIYYSYLYDTSD